MARRISKSWLRLVGCPTQRSQINKYCCYSQLTKNLWTGVFRGLISNNHKEKNPNNKTFFASGCNSSIFVVANICKIPFLLKSLWSESK